MIVKNKTERATKKLYLTGLFGIFLCCLVGSVIYSSVKEADAGVIFLKTTFPPAASSMVEMEPEPVITIQEPSLQDQETRLIAALQQDDIDVAYDKLQDKERWQVVRMRVTGYCSCRKCCGKFSDGQTASCHRIQRGDVFVAADKQYRFGTEMIIPGYNQTQPVRVLDRGRVIKGNRLDVYFDSHRQAEKWGVQYLDVLVKIND